jgi:hypothetical protein
LFCHKPDIHCPVAVSHNLLWIVVGEIAFTKLENERDKKKFKSSLIEFGLTWSIVQPFYRGEATAMKAVNLDSGGLQRFQDILQENP